MGVAQLDLVAQRALSGAAEITARDVATFTRAPFALWCESFAPKDQRDRIDEYVEMLFQQGRDHEARVVRERYPDAPPLVGRFEEDRFRAALAAMADGAKYLTQVPLFWLPEGLHGRVDVLERRDDAPSAFGAWHYVVKEIKLAKNLGPHHRAQGALYHRILSQLQGYTPPAFVLVNRDGVETLVQYDEPALLADLRAVRAIRAGELVPDVAYDEVGWPWGSYANERVEAARDVSLIGGVGPSRRATLHAAGLQTVDDVARATNEDLVALRGVGEKTATALKRSAEAIVAGTHTKLAEPVFRSAKTEVFLDLEGTGAQLSDAGVLEVDYLIGALVRWPATVAEGPGPRAEGSFSPPDARAGARAGAREEYIPFLAHTPDEEGDMWRAFLDWFAGLDDPVLYAWSHYEKTHLRRLATRHGIDPALKTRLDAALVDLLPIARDAYAFPTYGNSIKKIAPYCGFAWTHPGVGAMTSIAHYLAYVRDPVGARDRVNLVLDYNRDDCVAMRVVRDWVETNAPSP